MTGYIGYKKCIEEKSIIPCEIRGFGNVHVFKGSGCTFKCKHHGIDLEWIEDKK